MLGNGGYRFWRDPVFWMAAGAYAVHRWMGWGGAGRFMRGQFHDLLAIPAVLPPVLWVYERCGWRRAGDWPAGGEIAWHTVFWSLLWEVAGPAGWGRGTGDARDVAAYAAGAAMAWAAWRGLRRLNRRRRSGRSGG